MRNTKDSRESGKSEGRIRCFSALLEVLREEKIEVPAPVCLPLSASYPARTGDRRLTADPAVVGRASRATRQPGRPWRRLPGKAGVMAQPGSRQRGDYLTKDWKNPGRGLPRLLRYDRLITSVD